MYDVQRLLGDHRQLPATTPGGRRHNRRQQDDRNGCNALSATHATTKLANATTRYHEPALASRKRNNQASQLELQYTFISLVVQIDEAPMPNQSQSHSRDRNPVLRLPLHNRCLAAPEPPHLSRQQLSRMRPLQKSPTRTHRNSDTTSAQHKYARH